MICQPSPTPGGDVAGYAERLVGAAAFMPKRMFEQVSSETDVSASRQQAAQKDMLDSVRPDRRWDRMGCGRDIET